MKEAVRRECEESRGEEKKCPNWTRAPVYRGPSPPRAYGRVKSERSDKMISIHLGRDGRAPRDMKHAKIRADAPAFVGSA